MTPGAQLLLDQVDAAHGFVHAARAVDDADAGSLLGAIVARDSAWHDLLAVLDEPCGCDPGTCPR